MLRTRRRATRAVGVFAVLLSASACIGTSNSFSVFATRYESTRTLDTNSKVPVVPYGVPYVVLFTTTLTKSPEPVNFKGFYSPGYGAVSTTAASAIFDVDFQTGYLGLGQSHTINEIYVPVHGLGAFHFSSLFYACETASGQPCEVSTRSAVFPFVVVPNPNGWAGGGPEVQVQPDAGPERPAPTTGD